MGKIRVYQVAKELGLDSKELASRIVAMGINIRNYMSSLEPDEVVRIKRALERQRHEQMVEEEIKPGVTRRRSVRPRSQQRKVAAEAGQAEPSSVASETAVVKRRAAGQVERRGPAMPPPPEAAVLPSARPPAFASPQPPPPAVEELEPQPPAIEPEEVEVAARPSPPKKRKERKGAKAAEPPVAERVGAESLEEGAEAPAPSVVLQEPVPARPEPPGPPPPRPEPPRSAEFIERPEPPGPPEPIPGLDAPVAPEPPARPEPPVSKRLEHEGKIFVTLPPRTPERGAAEGSTFPLGPPSQGKAKRGRRQEIQGRDLRGGRVQRGGARARPGKKKKAAPGRKVRQTEITVPKESKRVIRIEATITLQELAKRMGVKATEVIIKLMEMGVGGIHINSMLDTDTAKIIAEEFSYQVEDVSVSEDELLAAAKADSAVEVPEEDRKPRPPVVTMLGHVDHGKTSLLDKIRESRVALGEAGGITQHIGAYQVNIGQGTITFIDTPGHEAFTAMRARGAKATDIAVLVVAADDGVMPTTREAIAHARAAETPIVVALNKMDLADANPDLALRGLAEENLQPEEWGGQTTVCRVSARSGQGIDQLLEMILLSAEMLELSANPDAPAQGVVLEAKLEKGRGPVATVLIQDGTLRAGDYVVAGQEHGKIRAMGDAKGQKLKDAGPSTPVEILGLSGVPQAGDRVDVVADARKGEQLAQMRAKAASAEARPPSSALADIMDRLRAQQEEAVETVNLVIKGDVQGSVEAIREEVISLSTEEVEVKVIHAGVGGITESDVMLASASDPKALIIGFNVRPMGKARTVADREHVEIRFHGIIYELLDDVKKMMLGRLRPTYQEVDLGRAEVRQTFHIPKLGTVAGCRVLDGKVARSAKIRLIRDSVEVWNGKLGSLKVFKDDVKEVAAGHECGIGLDGFNDVKVGDVIEAFDVEEISPTL